MLLRRVFSSRSASPRATRAKLVFFVQREGAIDFASVKVSSAARVDALKRAALATLRIDVCG